ncbi:MAG: peptidase S41, partial [Muribaculaceae bacterium]|nr:peptidase S41 [Muribaculaceae bacterium]
MQKFLIAGALLAAVSASAENAPLWLRNTAISPDGTQIAFTYKGDIYVVPAAGGQARQLTTSSAYDTRPLWSPDGKQIAFNSDREGSMDIFVMPATGGTPRRITTHSGREDLRAWAGNDTLLFSTSDLPAVNAAQGSFTAQVYKVGVENPGRPEMVMSWPANAISINADGKMLFQDKKGYEDVLRKHEHSSGTADIWLYNDGSFTQLTHTNVQNQNPVWAADGKSFYYITENENGTMNVHSRTLDGADKALTNFDRHPVRSLSVANNGTLAFSWNGEIYTAAPGAGPQKVNVDIIADIYRPSIRKSTETYNASSIAVSPDGSEVAFINGGDVYVTSVKYKTTKRITNTPEQERTVDFAPDGRTLVYDSERNGLWQLYTATIADKKEKNFTYATDIEEKLLYCSPDSLPAFQPAYSPDGKKVAFLEDRTALRVIDADGGKKAKTALDGKYNYSYTDGDVSFQWSPDSRWLLADYIGIGGWNNSDIALVKADGSEVIDLTESGYSDGGARWALGGKAVLWTTDRNGYRSHGSWGSQRDVYAIFLDPEAYDRFRMTEEEAALADEAKKGDKKEEKKDDDKDSDKDKKKKVEPLEFDLPNAK